MSSNDPTESPSDDTQDLQPYLPPGNDPAPSDSMISGEGGEVELPENFSRERRPRWWSPFAVAGIALLMCLLVSTFMVVLAMFLVLGDMNPASLAKPGTLASVMASRLGFCLIVIPPQLMLLFCSVGAACLSPVAFRRRLSLVRGHWPIWTWFAVAAAAPLIGLISTVVLSQFMTESENLKLMSDVFRDHCDSGFLIPLALIIGVTPALCEEILFRGYVQTRLCRSFSPVIGVAIASVMFAAFHMDFVHSIAVLPLGVFLGFVVARSGSIFPAMLAHFVNNAVSVVGVAFAPAGETDVLALPAIMVSLAILSAGMIGAGAVVFASVYYRPAAVTA